MKGRAFYRRKRFWVGVYLLLGLAVVAGSAVWVPSRAGPYAKHYGRSPSGEFFALALPRAGEGVQSSNGGMTICLQVDGSVIDKQATSLKGTRGTRLEWVAEARPERFRIFDEKGTRMVWRVEGERMVCVEGREFLVEKPEERDE